MEEQAKRLPGGGRVREYYAQLVPADGCYQLETRKVPHPCQDCGREDNTVRGLWGPFLGKAGRAGRYFYARLATTGVAKNKLSFRLYRGRPR